MLNVFMRMGKIVSDNLMGEELFSLNNLDFLIYFCNRPKEVPVLL
jgi:hypothetical protein